MARPLRNNREGGWYHVMNRGIERRQIFNDDADRNRFLLLLGELEENFTVQVHCYCLMSNHYHLALHTPAKRLSESLRWLGQSYTQYFNRRHDRVGPLFQGRFKSVPVDPEGWLSELSVYIHLNPLKLSELGLGKIEDRAEGVGAGEAPSSQEVSERLARLRTYGWSSYRSYGGYVGGKEWLHREKILGSLGKQRKGQQASYRRLVSERLKRGVDEKLLESIRERIALGSAEFIERMKKSGRREGKRESALRTRLQSTVEFEEIVELVSSERGEASEQWLHRYGDGGKWQVLLLARYRSGLTLMELGAKMGGMDYSAVSDGIRRFERHLQEDRRARREFEELKKKLARQ